MDWSAEFPGLATGTYLNSCAHGLLPRRARVAVEAHLDRWEAAPDWGAWGEAVERARAAFASFAGAPVGEVALQANASGAISAVMSALPTGTPRRRILTVDVDFPTAPFVAQRQRARGFEHEHLRTDGLLRLEDWARRLGDDVALACIPAVASFSGHRLDVKAFVEAAHARGVPVLVDGFQAFGAYPIDVRAWGADFAVTGVYKWLLSPAGLAFLHVRAERHAWAPTTGGWYAAADPYAFDPLGEVAPDARRFEYGGPSVVGCVAAAASLGLLEEVGLGEVERRVRGLVDRVFTHARERKWRVLTPEAPEARAGIVTFRVPDLGRALDACRRGGVVVNPRLGGIRVSPHFYNRDEDVDRLFEALDAAGA